MTHNARFAQAYGQSHISKSQLGKRRLSKLDAYELARKFNIGYCGDVNTLAYGGYFYRLKSEDIEAGYVDVVRLTPDENSEGNFWIDHGCVYLPRDLTTLKSALDCIGAFDLPAEDWSPMLIVEALVAYDGIDGDSWYFKEKDLTENQALNLCLDLLGVD